LSGHIAAFEGLYFHNEPEYLVHTTGDNLFLADDGILTNFGLLPGE
jgi:hypothetical protein